MHIISPFGAVSHHALACILLRLDLSQSLICVVIPDSITSIGKGTFWGCRNLESITISNSVTSIERAAFEECPNLVIFTPVGSYAEKFAKANNIKVELI